jgi:hypothetical protein
MKIDGMYRVEMPGPYGWEPIGTATLENGRYLEGGSDHYSVGRYQLEGSKVTCEATMSYQGKARTLFGKSKPSYAIRFEGELTGDQVNGVATDEDGAFLVGFRASRLGGSAVISSRQE